MSSIWTVGEVLIDLIPRTRGTGTDIVRDPVVGGGPANTAKALARLGLDSYFLCGFSTDAYGDQQRAEFTADNVKLDLAPTFDLPSATAHVTLDENGGASYIFTFDGTATFTGFDNWLPDPSQAPDVVYTGTLGTLIEPTASIIYDWIQKVKAPIVYDINVRSSVEGNRDKYRSNVVKWAALSDAIKLSDDDAHWLFPDQELEDVAKTFLAMGAKLVVITLGADGMIGFTSHGSVKVPGVKVDVVDTVGAGDTVGAIIVEAIIGYGLDNLHGETLEKTLNRAAQAAAITCSRAGAKPPTKAELDEC
jgi:fructokinase